MKRLMLSSLSVLLLCVATVPAVKAETAALNPTTLRSSSTTQLTPFNLVHLAHRGYFQEQGIPSYLTLATAYHSGRISAEVLVQAAVKANRLAPESLTDQGYLRSVEAHLRGLENSR